MTTIVDLLKLVPEGETRLFPCKGPAPYPERFRRVDMSWEYGEHRLSWENKPAMSEGPSLESRDTARRPIASLSELNVQFDGPMHDIVDLYATGTDAFFISKRLYNVIESLDPSSLECHAFNILANDGVMDYLIVMAKRQLDVICPEYTDILVKYENHAGKWFRFIKFPSGITLKNDISNNIHNFSVCDAPAWYWSNELIVAAKDAGVRGIIVRSSVRPSIPIVDQF